MFFFFILKFCFILFWGDLLYVCCHMRMQRVVSGESDWVRGWKRRTAGLDFIPPKETVGWENVHLRCFSIRLPVEVNIHMFAECTTSRRVISNCTCVTRLKCCKVRILSLYNWMKNPILTAGKQYRGRVHVRTFTMMFQCGCVKGKYHCYIHSRTLVFPYLQANPCCVALMVWFRVLKLRSSARASSTSLNVVLRAVC